MNPDEKSQELLSRAISTPSTAESPSPTTPRADSYSKSLPARAATTATWVTTLI